MNAKALALIKGQYAILDQLENPKDDSAEDSSNQNDKPVEPNENNNNNQPKSQEADTPVEPAYRDARISRTGRLEVEVSSRKLEQHMHKWTLDFLLFL